MAEGRKMREKKREREPTQCSTWWLAVLVAATSTSQLSHCLLHFPHCCQAYRILAPAIVTFLSQCPKYSLHLDHRVPGAGRDGAGRGQKGKQNISKNTGKKTLVKGTQMAQGHLPLKHQKTPVTTLRTKTLQTVTAASTV